MEKCNSSLHQSSQMLRVKDVENWLEKKHPKRAKEYGSSSRRDLIKGWMQSSYISDSSLDDGKPWNLSSESIIASNMLFIGSGDKNFVNDINELHSPELYDDALRVAKEVGKDRLRSGMNPATLNTEYRRKVILKALLDTSDVKDSRDDCKKKLTSFIKNRESVENGNISKSSSLSTYNSSNSFVKHRSLGSPSTSPSKDSKFRPEWKNYDIMRHRWSYLRPQTRELMDESSLILPEDNSQVICVDDEILSGSITDIRHYKRTQNTLKDDNSYSKTKITTFSQSSIAS